MEKRVRFKSAWLPWLLIAPQMAIVLVFFFWPAGQALYQSVLQEDAFGMSRQYVGMTNFERLWNDPSYATSFQTTAVFSLRISRLSFQMPRRLSQSSAAAIICRPKPRPRRSGATAT